MAARVSPQVELREIIQGTTAVDPDIKWEDLAGLLKDNKLINLMKSGKEISMLFTGKTGAGKSSLINSLIGQPVAMVEMGVQGKGVTQSVECYSENIDGVRVTVYDSPGLQDGSGRDEQYLEEMHKKCKDVDLIIFAVRIGDNRFVHGDATAQTMVKFTRKFGNLIWKKTLVVITCIDLMEEQNPQLRTKTLAEKQDFFKKDISETKDLVRRALREQARVPNSIAKKVRVVPTGSELQSRLLDGTLWLTNFWLECLSTIPTPESRVSMVKMSVKRIKTEESVTRTDFEKPLDEQPIVIPTKMTESTATVVTLGTVMTPAVVGGLVGALGLLGGSLGLVGIPVGIFTGMIVGAVVAAYRDGKSKEE